MAALASLDWPHRPQSNRIKRNGPSRGSAGAMRVAVFLEGQTTLRKCPNRKTVPTWISKIPVPPTEQQRRTEPTSVHYLSPAAELRSSPALNKVPGVAALQLHE